MYMERFISLKLYIYIMPAKTMDEILMEQSHNERLFKAEIADMEESTRLKECWEKNGHRHPGETVAIYFYKEGAAGCYCSNCKSHYARKINDEEMKMLKDCMNILY